MSARWTTADLAAFQEKQKAKKPSKYRNEKVEVDGMVFDSKAEARHYGHLKMAENAGFLTFERQVAYRFEVTYRGENGKEVKRKMKYVADFVVALNDGRVQVQDVKGTKTREYKQKKRLMLDVYGIEIKEIK